MSRSRNAKRGIINKIRRELDQDLAAPKPRTPRNLKMRRRDAAQAKRKKTSGQRSRLDGIKISNRNAVTSKAPLSPKTITLSEMPALRKEILDHTQGHHAFQRKIVCCIFALTWRLVRNEGQFSALRQDSFFEDFQCLPEKDEAAKYVAYWTMKAESPRVRDRACRYAAIAERWLREGLKPRDAEQRLLEEGKITGAYALSSKMQPAAMGSKSKAVTLKREEYSRQEPEGDLEQETEAAPLKSGSKPPNEPPTAAAPTPPVPKTPRFNPRTDLIVTTNSAVVAAGHLTDGPYTMLVEVTVNRETGWKDIRLTSMEPSQE